MSSHGDIHDQRDASTQSVACEAISRLALDPFKAPNEIVTDFIKLQKHNHKIVASITKFAESIKQILLNADKLSFPSEMLHPKDYIEYRYLQKRTLYLAYLTSILIEKGERGDATYLFDFLDGDELRPIILVNCISVNCVLRLIPAISTDAFPLYKLTPSACRAERNTGLATPEYNASITADAYHLKNADLQREVAASCDGFEGSLILGSIWLSRNGYSSHLLDGGFGNTEWALLQSYVVAVANPNTSSRYTHDPFQLFKSVLKALASIEFIDVSDCKQGFNLQGDISSSIGLKQSYNFLFKMSRWSHIALKCDANAVLSLNRMGLSAKSQFRNIFLETENRCYRNYDLVTSLPIQTEYIIQELPQGSTPRWNIGHAINDYCYKLFARGLGNRCKSMSFSMPKPPPQTLRGMQNAQSGSSYKSYNLQVFLILDDKNSLRFMDYGPDLENSNESARFRDFWREKAELRRFKNGRIVETVKWEITPSATEQIIRFLYQRIVTTSTDESTLSFYGPGFETCLTSRFPMKTATILFDRAVSEFQIIADAMRQLNNFPLSFREIRGACPELRFTSANPPSPFLWRLNSVLEAEIELESSSRWPIDLEQRKRSELGLLLKLAVELKQTGNFASAQVGTKDNSDVNSRDGFLDVLTKTHYRFRFRLVHVYIGGEGITGLLRGANTDSPFRGSIKPQPYEKSYHEDMVLRKFKQYGCFSSVVRLVKMWFQSQYLASYFGDEMLELFGGIGFNPHSALAIPGSTFCGFRQAMITLSQWDWRKRPLEIELLSSFTDDERMCLLLEFQSRQVYPTSNDEVALSVAIAGGDGTIKELRRTIPRMVAVRMTELARKAHIMLLDFSTPFDKFFQSNLESFDFLILLQPIEDLQQNSEKYANITTVPNGLSRISTYEYLLREMQALFGEAVLFLPSSDSLVIGALWKTGRVPSGYTVPVDAVTGDKQTVSVHPRLKEGDAKKYRSRSITSRSSWKLLGD
ncbi:hypothetical protein ABW20_dc0102399 [Dactylellina cionopaga]|nr:hypothetical protein ABW20_dc0102399 [Dactylellina cionopaga]